jgi:hypothetical protein
MVHTPPNLLLQAESDIVNLLHGSPVMPPTVLVRPFEESLEETGKVFSNDNIIVKFTSIDPESTIESEDEIVQKWRVSFEIMLILRDLRGHHPAYQLMETILMLLTGYKVLGASRGIAPRSAKWTEKNENSYRYWSIIFEYEIETCMPTYMDPFEPVPKELRCIDSDCKWTGFNHEGNINVCWRRYQKSGEDKFRYYNACSQKPGDEIRNYYFDKPFGCPGSPTPEYDENDDIPTTIVEFPGVGPVEWISRIPLSPIKINIGLYRNTAPELNYPLATYADEARTAQIEVEAGSDIISHSNSCVSCGI